MLEGFEQGSDVIWSLFKENDSGIETRLDVGRGNREIS